MDEQKNTPEEAILPEEEVIAQEKTGYQPRPMWQVWAARLGLVIFILFIILFYIQIARGGI